MPARRILLAILLTCAGNAAAQGLTVVSTTPSEGAVDVPLTSEIQFRLSDPLPFTGTAFTEKVIWSPRDSLRVLRYGHALDESDEIRLIFYEVEHRPSTDYTFILHGIRDANGVVLERPLVLNYTTAPTAGSITVSGTVSAGERPIPALAKNGEPGPAPDGLEQTVVLLLRQFGFAESSWEIARAAVADAGGAYAVDGVRPGTYWPLAVQFADGVDGGPPAYGIYDENADGVADSLVVPGNVGDVGLMLHPYLPATARELLPFAVEAIEGTASEPVLTGIFAGPDFSGGFRESDGKVYSWLYAYCSRGDDVVATVDVTPIDLFVVAEAAETDTVATCLQTPLPALFVDSDAAMAVADANGGSAFRAKYQDIDVSVFLSLGDLPLPVRPAPDEVFWAIDYVSPPGVPFEQLTLFVDAESGMLLQGVPVSAQEPIVDVPSGFVLAQNYPNPFNPRTTIEYVLESAARVSLTVFDVQGREVGRLVEGLVPSGRYRVRWDASAHPVGVYWYRLQVGDASVTRPMVYVK